MRTPGWIAAAIVLATAAGAVGQGLLNQTGVSGETVTIVLGTHGRLVTGGQRNSGQSVQLWLGTEGSTVAEITREDWLEAAGFTGPAETLTIRRAWAVLEPTAVPSEPGPAPAGQLTLVDLSGSRKALMLRYPDRSRTLVAPVDVRRPAGQAPGAPPATAYLANPLIHVPGGTRAEGSVLVRTGSLGIPYILRP